MLWMSSIIDCVTCACMHACMCVCVCVTVQSLVNLDDYNQSDSASLGQLKITMAQFFRVNGGSTQNRGVIPDIQFPATGDSSEYGERSLDHALPWTQIEAADYQATGDLSQLAAVADFRYNGRNAQNQEYAWLMADIEEYNRNRDEVSVSLLESTRREEMARNEAKRKEREAQRKNTGPLFDEVAVLTNQQQVESAEIDEEEDEEEDDRPDLLLRESAKVVADMIELVDSNLLAQQLSLLQAEEASKTVN